MLCILEKAAALRKLFLFSLHQLRGLDLPDLEFEKIQLPLSRCLIQLEGSQLFPSRHIALVQRGHLLPQRTCLVAAEGIQYTKMRTLLQKALMLMLTMNVDQQLCHSAKLSQRHRLIIDLDL